MSVPALGRSPSAYRTPKKSTGNFKIAKGAVVCSEAQLVGDITIGTQTVIHPSARILAEGGPIVIGSSNLIQEQVTIVNRKSEDGQTNKPMVIGCGNVFEVGAYCESPSVGENNTFEGKSKVGPDTTISDRCAIGAACEINCRGTLSPDTVVYGSDCYQYTKKSHSQTTNQQQLEYLIKVLPSYHHLLKTNQPT